MARKRNTSLKLIKWLFFISLGISGYILFSFVPFRDIAENLPVVSNYFPKTEIKPTQSDKVEKLYFSDLKVLSQELKNKERRLADWERELQRREETLTRMKLEVERYRAQVDTMQTKISGLITEIDSAEAVNLKKLSRIYNTMDPEEAANLIANMEDDEIINIFSRMKARQVGKILGAYATKDDESSIRAANLVEQIRMLTTKLKQQRKDDRQNKLGQ